MEDLYKQIEPITYNEIYKIYMNNKNSDLPYNLCDEEKIINYYRKKSSCDLNENMSEEIKQMKINIDQYKESLKNIPNDIIKEKMEIFLNYMQDNYKIITIEEFLLECKKMYKIIIDNIIELNKSGVSHKHYFYIHEINKSSWWMIILFIDYIEKSLNENDEIKDKIFFIDSYIENSYSGSKVYNIPYEDCKNYIYFFDDCAYTGYQISTSIAHFLNYIKYANDTENNVFTKGYIYIPYITETSYLLITRLYENKLDYHKYLIVNEIPNKIQLSIYKEDDFIKFNNQQKIKFDKENNKEEEKDEKIENPYFTSKLSENKDFLKTVIKSYFAIGYFDDEDLNKSDKDIIKKALLNLKNGIKNTMLNTTKSYAFSTGFDFLINIVNISYPIKQSLIVFEHKIADNLSIYQYMLNFMPSIVINNNKNYVLFTVDDFNNDSLNENILTSLNIRIIDDIAESRLIKKTTIYKSSSSNISENQEPVNIGLLENCIINNTFFIKSNLQHHIYDKYLCKCIPIYKSFKYDGLDLLEDKFIKIINKEACKKLINNSIQQIGGNIDYKQKYDKYKLKYLQLKQNKL